MGRIDVSVCECEGPTTTHSQRGIRSRLIAYCILRLTTACLVFASRLLQNELQKLTFKQNYYERTEKNTPTPNKLFEHIVTYLLRAWSPSRIV